MNEVRWIGRGFRGNAKLVYEEIQSIGDSYTPQDILELARDESTELHKCFDWDDTTAAEKWRLHTARLICGSLQVVIHKEESDPVTYRVIQHDDAEKAYKPVTLTVRNEEEYGRLVKQAKAELKAFKERYKRITELSAVIEEIDRVLGE